MARGFVPLHLMQTKHRAEKEAKKQEALNRHRAIMSHAYSEDEKGLRRLILPEYHRPFIQALSKAAGKIARADLKNMA